MRSFVGEDASAWALTRRGTAIYGCPSSPEVFVGCTVRVGVSAVRRPGVLGESRVLRSLRCLVSSSRHQRG